MKVKVSRIRLFATPWTIQSIEFSRPDYWRGQPFLSLGDLSNLGIEPWSPALQADSLPAEPQGKPNEACWQMLTTLSMFYSGRGKYIAGSRSNTKGNLNSKYFPSCPPSNLPKPQQILCICRVFLFCWGMVRGEERNKTTFYTAFRNTANVAYGSQYQHSLWWNGSGSNVKLFKFLK